MLPLADLAWPTLITLFAAAAFIPLMLWRHGGRRRLGGGTHVFITGGSKGLGLSLARLCVERGCSVTVVARNKQDLAEAQRQLQQVAEAAAATGGAAVPSKPIVQALAADTTDLRKVRGEWSHHGREPALAQALAGCGLQPPRAGLHPPCACCPFKPARSSRQRSPRASAAPAPSTSSSATRACRCQVRAPRCAVPAPPLAAPCPAARMLRQ